MYTYVNWGRVGWQGVRGVGTKPGCSDESGLWEVTWAHCLPSVWCWVCVHSKALPVFFHYLPVSALVPGASVPSRGIKVNNKNLGAVPLFFRDLLSSLLGPPLCQQTCVDFSLKCGMFRAATPNKTGSSLRLADEGLP